MECPQQACGRIFNCNTRFVDETPNATQSIEYRLNAKSVALHLLQGPILSTDRVVSPRTICVRAHDARLSEIRGGRMGSPIVKRSVGIAGHKTSISLEDNFWAGLKFVAGEKKLTLSELVAAIDEQREHDNLSSAIRQFLFDY